MRVRNYLLCSSLCLLTNFVHAACPGGYSCATISFAACLTAQGAAADCSDGGQSPVIAYAPGTGDNGWNPVIGETVNFNTIPDSGVTSPYKINLTLGTLNPNAGLYMISSTAPNQFDSSLNYNVICSDSGTCGSGASKIPYTVEYQACDGSSQFISPDQNGPASLVTYSHTAVNFAGTNPVCDPQNGGGAGQLTFNIIPASTIGATAYGGGTYTGQFCVNICTVASGCLIPSSC